MSDHTMPASAAALAADLIATTKTLLSLIRQESTVVRSGRINEAMQLEKQKTTLSQRYLQLLEMLKTNSASSQELTPQTRANLRQQHQHLEAELRLNLTVLATAQAVSEGILRGVNEQMRQRQTPQCYTGSGAHAAVPARNAAPLSLSRQL